MRHFHLADQYRRGTSLVHRLDPRAKLLATLGYILTAALLPPGHWLEYALLLSMVTLAAAAAGLGAGYALRRSFVALPFALAAITLPFTVPGHVVGHLGPWAISAEGLVRFASILTKSWLSLQAAILLGATTAFPDLLWGLRDLRVPQPLVAIVAFMYRYLFVLADEALRLMRARAARSAAGGGRAGGGLVWRGRVAGGMVGSLTLRSFERSERIYDAMLARGFQGQLKTLEPPRAHPRDALVLAGWLAAMAFVLLLGFIF
jgi:cobalt/nickel transport system permease protein